MTKRRFRAIAACAGLAVALTACSAGSPGAARGTNPTITSAGASRNTVTAPAPTGQPTPASTAPSGGEPVTVDQQAIDQISTELGTLGSTLDTVNSDLDDPQADS